MPSEGLRRGCIVCGEEMAKETVKQKVKKLLCKVGAQRAIDLKDGTLTYTIEWDAANASDYVTDYLMKTL